MAEDQLGKARVWLGHLLGKGLEKDDNYEEWVRTHGEWLIQRVEKLQEALAFSHKQTLCPEKENLGACEICEMLK